MAVARMLGCTLASTLAIAATAHAAPGELDPTFGDGGLAVTDFGAPDQAVGVTIDPAGRIVAGGTTGTRFGVARHLPAGALDPDFATGGLMTVGFGGPSNAGDLAPGPDSKIVVAGTTNAGPNPSNFALTRLTSGGSLDPTFDGTGTVITDIGGEDSAEAVAIAPDGKVVVAGGTFDGSSNHFALARYTVSGSPDVSFDGTGQLTTDFGVDAHARAVAIGPGGRIVAGGNAGGNFALARYNSDGSPDQSFGADGKVTHYFAGYSDSLLDLALYPDGRVLVAGTAGGGFALARFNPGGGLDQSFGQGGKVVTSFGPSIAVAHGVAIAPEGWIVAGGFVAGDFALARYHPDGSLDPTFAAGGRMIDDLGGEDRAQDVAIDASGRILLAGLTDSGPNPPNFALTRYQGGAAKGFRIVRIRRNKRRGTARAVVRVPGPGQVVLRRTGKLKRAARDAEQAGRLRLELKPRAKAKRRLSKRNCRSAGNRRLRVRATAKLVFRPIVGEGERIQRRLRLVRRC